MISFFNSTSDYFLIPGQQTSISQISSIYIINLPRRVDRRIDSIGLIHRLDLQASLVPAYSISSPSIPYMSLTSTELACWASHFRLWRTLHHQQNNDSLTNRWTMILEDDVDVEIDLVQRIESFPSSIWTMADLIYLGHCANPPGQLIHQSHRYHYRIHYALHPTCTHAYLIRSTSLDKLLSLLSKPRRSIDESIVELVRENQLIVLSIHPPFAKQKIVNDGNPSDINRIDRRSLKYQMGDVIYRVIQWWNGVEKDQDLLRSTLKRINRKRANQWRIKHEHSIWLNYSS